jgi:hypothetical protein
MMFIETTTIAIPTFIINGAKGAAFGLAVYLGLVLVVKLFGPK